ncbi:MAG: HIT domain-containing protein [Agromyces sp.]
MTESRAEPTLFERIAAREIPARVVAETDRVIAFHDIAPKAPVHVVVTPKTGEYRDVVELAAGDPGLLAELVEVSRGVADELAGGQFRLVFNTGAAAGQTIFHVHAHVLADNSPAGGLEEATLAGD